MVVDKSGVANVINRIEVGKAPGPNCLGESDINIVSDKAADILTNESWRFASNYEAGQFCIYT